MVFNIELAVFRLKKGFVHTAVDLGLDKWTIILIYMTKYHDYIIFNIMPLAFSFVFS